MRPTDPALYLADGYPDWKLDPDHFTIEQVAEKARTFLYDEHFSTLGLPAGTGGPFGFVVAGYSAGAQLSEVWLVEIQNGTSAAPKSLLGQGVTSVYAGGDPELFSRVVNGFSLNLPTALQKIGLDQSKVPEAMKVISQELGMPLVEPPMPIQDAIDFAEFLVSSTSLFTRFKRGAPTVGGPVEVAAITKHEHFKWVMRKHYFDDTLNPRGVS